MESGRNLAGNSKAVALQLNQALLKVKTRLIFEEIEMTSSGKLNKSAIGYGLSIALAGITLIYTQYLLATVAISQPALF